MRIESRRGQAMIELGAGMFALALVVSALCLFAVYIARSLEIQNSARGHSPKPGEDIEVDDFLVRQLGFEQRLKPPPPPQIPNGYQ